jgi:hypothetical protein
MVLFSSDGEMRLRRFKLFLNYPKVNGDKAELEPSYPKSDLPGQIWAGEKQSEC